MGCGADTEANSLLASLKDITDTGLTLPDLTSTVYQIPQVETGPAYTAITKITNAHLTEATIEGNGTFDILMRGFKAHLLVEYEKGRITGEQYSKAYIELTQAAMAQAVQYLLGREQSYWQALLGQMQTRAAEINVIQARVEAEAAKVKLTTMQYEALNAQAAYTVGKMKLATDSITYCSAKYNLDYLLPKQLEKATKENSILQNELDLFPLKQNVVKEQGESARAQTMDTRTDGTPVAGVMGKQVGLYDQQITSYKRDAEMKAAKLFTDAWITMKTIDEGVLPPNGFTNASLDQVLSTLKINNNLGS